jgi:hypothetical protein
MTLFVRGQQTVQLNEDIVNTICDNIYERIAAPIRAGLSDPWVHPALKPLPFGKCMLFKLPAELRRKIFAEYLPAKDKIIEPVCTKAREIARDLKRKPKHNTTSDLLVLNKKLKDEITLCVYAERVFAIHVHEGIHTGGIEFLDSGRQPLQYKEADTDDRFARFDTGKEFSFHELKKIEVTIFPPTEDSRHSALNTYYMNHALARMLERGGENGAIVSLTINFASQPEGEAHNQHSRRGIMRGEHWWWDPEQVSC